MKIQFKCLIIIFLILLSCKEVSKETKPEEKEIPKQDVQIPPKKKAISREERIRNYKSAMDSLNTSLNWRKTKFGLWKSKKGDLGLKTIEGNEEGIMIDRYITYLAEGKPLVEVIDTITFKYLGSSFYKDKNNIYTHYEMSDGGNFWIVKEADVKTFKILGSCYAKDKNYIYGERAMKIDAMDYKTFKTCNDCGCFAKDKRGYYFWDKKMDLETVIHKETLVILDKLKKL